ncbi:MAG TPA: hypothetical protein QGF01_04490 [Candidatus Nitrosopelagicus sp.]|nr:hypothetical protein [Candidatus Nitrosopelagicus sp.]
MIEKLKGVGDDYLPDLLAVIASQYTKPGAKPTISGMKTPIILE